MDRSQKIKQTIVETIGNPDERPGEWKEVTFSRSNAEQIAEAIYEALKSRGYLAEPDRMSFQTVLAPFHIDWSLLA